jgi:hypothetical protein
LAAVNCLKISRWLGLELDNQHFVGRKKMSLESQQIVSAIESLRQVDNLWKDWIFPIAMAFFSALIGGLVAYLVFLRQEFLRREKEKIEIINRWTLASQGAVGTLKAIKSNYFENLTNNPFQRASSVQTIIFRSKEIDLDLSLLSFLAPSQSVTRSSLTPFPKWSDLAAIQALFDNYHYLLTLWEKRNLIDRDIREHLAGQRSAVGYAELSEKLIRELIPGGPLTQWIQLTEIVIKLTDELIIEFEDFYYNFAVFAESRIKHGAVKNYATLLKLQTRNPGETSKILNKTVAPDYSSILDLFGQTSAEMHSNFKTGYE